MVWGQVLGFVARRAYAWAVVFAVAFIGRTAMDWLLPTTDFRLRPRFQQYWESVSCCSRGSGLDDVPDRSLLVR